MLVTGAGHRVDTRDWPSCLPTSHQGEKKAVEAGSAPGCPESMSSVGPLPGPHQHPPLEGLCPPHPHSHAPTYKRSHALCS